MVAVLVPDDYFGEILGAGLLAKFVMMLLGIPIYVCATASVPIAAMLIAKGITPGAALVFLMTGPATNVATIATISKLIGRRAALVYLVTVAVSALGAGMLLDAIYTMSDTRALASMPWMVPDFVGHASAVVLLGVIAFALLVRPSEHAERPDQGEAPRSATLEITGMTCGHCAETIARTLLEFQGVSSADVDLKSGQAVVRGAAFEVSDLRRSIEELGYGVKQAGMTE